MTDIDKLIRDLRQPGGDDARDRPRPSDRDPRFGRATPRVDGPDPLAGRHEETVMTPRQQAIEAMAEASHEAFRQMCAEWEAPLKWSDVEEEVREETRQNSAAQLDALLAELPGMGLLPPMPRESTTEMEDAAGDVSDHDLDVREWNAGEVWAAMCAVAPNVPRKIEP